jgi:hypothetical protein
LASRKDPLPKKGGSRKDVSTGIIESIAEIKPKTNRRKDTETMTSTQTTRKINHFFGTLVALAMMAAVLAFSELSAHASAEQGGGLEQDVSGSTKMDAAVATTSSTSTTPKASFASGSGANFLGVKVSDHGNLMSFESPQGQEQLFDGQEGYAVCNSAGGAFGHDTGSVEGGFGAPTFSQPTAGAFPLTVTRKTTDGKLKLTQVWNKPDSVEKDVTVSMTVTNLTNSPLFGLALSRSGDFDVGNSGQDQGARTGDSAWQWDDVDSSVDTSRGGAMLTALTPGTNHFPQIALREDWTGRGGTDLPDRVRCFGSNLLTPTAVQDLAMRMAYNLGDFNGGQSKTVKFEYRRM